LHAFKIRIQVFLYLTSSQPFSKGEGQRKFNKQKVIQNIIELKVLSFGEDLGEVDIGDKH